MLKEDSKFSFVLYDVILTFGGWGFPDMMFFNFFIMLKNLESDCLSEIVLSSFPDNYNTNAAMKYMPIPVLTHLACI